MSLMMVTRNNIRKCLSSVTRMVTTVGYRSMHGQKIVIDGYNIHYEKVGHGPKRLLLLPGALGSTRTDFNEQLRPDGGLSHELFTILAWDPPGFGYSRPPERNLSPDHDFYRSDSRIVSKLAQKIFDGNQYSVMGWSDGGITGLILASNHGSSHVDKLVVWGCNAFITDQDKKCTLNIRNTDDWSLNFRKSFEEIYGSDVLKKLWSDFVDRYQLFGDICSEDLQKISCPVFLLNGDKDPMIDPIHPEFIKNHVKDCNLYRFPEGKHNIHIKYSKQFNQMVTEFLLK